MGGQDAVDDGSGGAETGRSSRLARAEDVDLRAGGALGEVDGRSGNGGHQGQEGSLGEHGGGVWKDRLEFEGNGR